MLQGMNPSRVDDQRRNPKTFGSMDGALCFHSSADSLEVLQLHIPIVSTLRHRMDISSTGGSPTTFAVEMERQTIVLKLPCNLLYLK